MPSTKRPGEEAEGSARKKLSSSTRTGQACDRCKIRKIRCDARPGGCSPCLQNNTECKTTDRITGRATSRGHTEQLENENGQLKMYMVELQAQLREHGIDPKPPPDMSQGFAHLQPYWAQNEAQQGSWGHLSTSGLVPSSSQNARHSSQGSLLPDFRPGCIGDNYLGVSSGNDWLSPIEGTQLALFGMKIDLAEFLPPENDPASDPLSYQTFLFHAFKKSERTYAPPLPNHDVCRKLAEWFFKSVQMFVPVLHRPDFMKLLSRIHHGHYQPNPAETVMVHMMLTVMNFQTALRNGDEQARVTAMNHFHYSLSFIPDLISGHQLQDIQALALICMQLRSQPRLGAAWMFTNTVLGLAMELGLHRSAKAWQGDNAESNQHTIEMRKRVFWSLLMLHVNLSGKLGRPMPLRLEDFDIEIPEHLPDNLPDESNASKWAKCSFRAALQGLRLLRILMRVYSTVYAVRTSYEPYEMNIRSLEKELRDWRAQLPPELAGGSQSMGDDRTPALFLESTEHEIRLLLHHPSLCRSTSPKVIANNQDVCLDASRKMLTTASRLNALKSLDTTWYFATTCLAAIFTTLFAWTQRQDQMTSADLQQLKQDMDAWIDVMSDVGNMLGAGLRLQSAITSIVDTSLANIARHLAAKTASAGLASAASPDSPTDPSQRQHQMYADTNDYGHAYTNGTSNGTVSHDTQQAYTMNDRATGQVPSQPSYPSGNHFYQETPAEPIQSYVGSFDPAAYNTNDLKPNIHAQLNNHNVMPHAQVSHQQSVQQNHQSSQMNPHQAPPSFMAAFQSPAAGQNGFHTASPGVNMQHPAPAAWRHFTDNMVTSISGQDNMSSANALIALQGDKGQQHGMHMAAANIAGMSGLHMAPHGQQQPWPLIYNTGAGEGQ